MLFKNPSEYLQEFAIKSLLGGGGGAEGWHTTVVAFALPDPAAPGSNPGVPEIFSEKIFRENCQSCRG